MRFREANDSRQCVLRHGTRLRCGGSGKAATPPQPAGCTADTAGSISVCGATERCSSGTIDTASMPQGQWGRFGSKAQRLVVQVAEEPCVLPTLPL